MKGSAQHRKTIEVVNITSEPALSKFFHFIESEWVCTLEKDRGSSVIRHYTLTCKDNSTSYKIRMIIYSTNTIFLQTAPRTPKRLFDDITNRINELAHQSITRVSDGRQLTFQRAHKILNFISNLDSKDEIQRMVILILSDTINEIVLTEQMKKLKIAGSALKQGIPDKIETIRRKHHVVYREEEIKEVREYRNAVVHQGNVLLRKQAELAAELADDVLSKN